MLVEMQIQDQKEKVGFFSCGTVHNSYSNRICPKGVKKLKKKKMTSSLTPYNILETLKRNGSFEEYRVLVANEFEQVVTKLNGYPKSSLTFAH